MASPLTVFASEASGTLRCINANWADACGATPNLYGPVTTGTTYIGIALSTNYYVWVSFFDFVTSDIPDTATVTAVAFSLFTNSGAGTFPRTVQVRGPFDWGGTLTTADWRPGVPSASGDVQEYTLLASLQTADVTAYQAWTSEAAFASNISKTGTTSFFVHDTGFMGDSPPAPTDVQRIVHYLSDYAGTDHDPKLYIEYSEASGVVTDGLIAEYVGRLAKAGATFGWKDAETGSNPGLANFKAASKFTLSEDGTVSKLTAYYSNGASACAIKGFIYTDAAGEPSTIVTNGVTDELSVGSSLAAGWRDLTFSTPPELSAGTYWLGIWASGAASSFDLKSSSEAGNLRVDADTYDGSITSPWGTSDYSDPYNFCIYATYTVSPNLPGNNTDPTSTWDDLVGANDIALSNLAWTTASGWNGTGTPADPYYLDFDSDAYGAATSLDTSNSGARSYEFWVKNSSDTANVFGHGTGVAANFAPYVSSASNRPLFQANSECYRYWAENSKTYDGAWHHYVLTMDGLSSIAEFQTSKLYIDGELQTVASGSYTDSPASNSSGIRFGTAYRASFTEGMATFRFYSKALSSTEVSQNYAAGLLAASTDAEEEVPDLSFLLVRGIGIA